MYIQSLHIYGYGKLIDQVFDLENGIHIFYGENEAGKSTILSFIQSILFGFPTKNQIENRYEPKQGMRYGGRITVVTKQYGVVAIERLLGKASGDVKVYLENGTMGNEDLLNEILHGLDKKTFTSIFSFGLQGLQEIQTIKADELSQYLFSSSVLGNDQVVEIEKKIVKEMDSLFKPGGKKPEINHMLEEITSLSSQLGTAKAQITHYQSLITEEHKLQNEMITINNELNSHSELIRKLELFEQYAPLRIEFKTIEEKQHGLGDSPSFPVEGLKKLDLLLSSMIPVEARLKSIQKQYAGIRLKASSICINESLLDAEIEVQSLVSYSTRNDLACDALSNVSIQIQALEEEIATKKKSLGIDVSNSELVGLDLSLSRKEEVRRCLQMYHNVLNKKDILLQQQEEMKSKVKNSEELIKQYETRQLPSDKKIELEQLVQQNNTALTSADKDALRSKLDRLSNQIREHVRRDSNLQQMRNLLFLPLSLVIFMYGLWNIYVNHLGGAIGSVILSLLLAMAGFLLTKYGTNHSFTTLLLQEKEELSQQLSKQNGTHPNHERVKEAEILLAKQEQIEQLLQRETILLQQLEKEYDKTITQFEEWEKEFYQISSKLVDLKDTLRIPKEYNHDSVMDIYEQIQVLVSNMLDLEKKNKEKVKLEEEIQNYTIQFSEIWKRTNVAIPLKESTPQVLVRELEKEKEKAKEKRFLVEKERELQHEMNALEKELLHYQEQIGTLYNLAGVKDEDSFREKATLQIKWNELQERKERLREKTQLLLKKSEELEKELLTRWNEFEVALNQKDTIEMSYKNLKEKEKEQIRKLADLSLQKRQIEEQGTYSTLLHQFETKKSALMYKAKQWAKLSIAKDLLHETKTYYQLVRLPSVLSKAEYYFSILTEKAYVNIYPPNEKNGFIVERNDGTRFLPQELSQGTAEQLYLSLRLALAANYKPNASIPLVIDDGFVNFDDARLQVTFTLLKELSKERQIIFFTCHKEAITLLKKEGLTHLQQNRIIV